MMCVTNKHKQAGLSLVELMVAVALGMLLMLGVMQAFLGSKNIYTSNQELSEIQESGRFALELLTTDIRNAGYKGQCIDAPVNHVEDSVNPLWSRSEGAVVGWTQGGAPSFISDSGQSDGVFIQFAVGGGEAHRGASTNSITNDEVYWDAGTSSSLKEGDIALISDGQGCDLFEVDEVGSDYIKKEDDGSKNWSHEYINNFELLRLASVAYYIKAENDVPTLHRSYFNYELDRLDTHALVSGVADIKIEYGVQKNGATKYFSADKVGADWENVAAIRVTLDIESASGLKKPFSTLIALRNRLL